MSLSESYNKQNSLRRPTIFFRNFLGPPVEKWLRDSCVDENFLELIKELLDSEMTAEEYIDFDIKTCTSVPDINSDEVDWRVSSVEKCNI